MISHCTVTPVYLGILITALWHMYNAATLLGEMVFFVPRIVMVFVNRHLAIQGSHWPVQLHKYSR